MTQNPVLDKLYCKDIERHVLGTLFVDPGLADQLVPALTTRDFYLTRHQRIFEAISRIWHNGEPIDVYGVMDELGRLGYQDESDDIAELNHIINTNVDQFLFGRHHADRLVGYRKLRDRLELGQMIADLVYKGTAPDEIDARVDERLREWGTGDEGGWLYGKDSIALHNRILEQRRIDAENGRLRRFDWPWVSWNKPNRVRPLRPGLVGILAAPDGIGKSTYLEMIAEHWAIVGHNVVLVHLEDDHEYKLDRRLSRYSQIPLAVIEDGTLTEEEGEMRDMANYHISQWIERLRYLHRPGATARQVVREIESRHDQGLCDAVVIDYLDKFRPDRRQAKIYGDNSWERQADDMETIKCLAEQLHIPILTATQGNKTMQGAGTQTRASIQGSGQKSQKSQLVIIVTRQIAETQMQDQHGRIIAEAGQYSPFVDIRIDKQNRGATCQFQQYLKGQVFTIKDLAHEQRR